MKCVMCEKNVPEESANCPGCGESMGQWKLLDDEANAFINDGLGFVSKGDNLRAALSFLNAAVLQPDTGKPLEYLGKVLASEGCYDEAIFYLKKCILLNTSAGLSENKSAQTALDKAEDLKAGGKSEEITAVDVVPPAQKMEPDPSAQNTGFVDFEKKAEPMPPQESVTSRKTVAVPVAIQNLESEYKAKAAKASPSKATVAVADVPMTAPRRNSEPGSESYKTNPILRKDNEQKPKESRVSSLGSKTTEKLINSTSEQKSTWSRMRNVVQSMVPKKKK
jgi:hypothetical protein